jgi:hypothetical protein
MFDARDTNDSITQFAGRAEFPCVAAKSLSNRNHITERVYSDLLDMENDYEILNDVERFNTMPRDSFSFRSFAAIFQAPLNLSEVEFETAMWNRLQSLHDLDAETHEWDRKVSCDPSSPNFSFSLRGTAFYIIGLHPNASRLSRRYHRPALIFNLHDQFEILRRQGRYPRMRDVIRKRDAAMCGLPNPSLQNFGEASEARQYSGRAVREDWRCPFQARPRRRHP